MSSPWTTFVKAATLAYQDQLKQDHPRRALVYWAIRRYEQVCLWSPPDYLDATPQWEIDLLWLVHTAKATAEREVNDRAIAEAKRS